ncbi:Scr1 family TA system antitoxin-like transcriptional regulator [Micromonospora chokoriensis]|uniref:Scr1 family TA system antitoxin-like transcriptional regulator n=1 Tax=Micromonospora chokoriensis TaxID=356851 RepID=UPI001E5AA335|nr:Scr1 family TA system antitoxin-like transcriptional regulator [Micromonospora chokoriensis]
MSRAICRGPTRFSVRRGSPALRRPPSRSTGRLRHGHGTVRIQVVPIPAGAYAGLGGPFVIASSSQGEDLVYLAGQRHGQVIDRADYVRQMVEVWESIRGEALSQQQSLDLIAEVAETWS